MHLSQLGLKSKTASRRVKHSKFEIWKSGTIIRNICVPLCLKKVIKASGPVVNLFVQVVGYSIRRVVGGGGMQRYALWCEHLFLYNMSRVFSGMH